MNYFVDEDQLQIKEKNIYTATEVVTLIPMQGDAQFENFFAANSWTKDYLPNNYLRISSAKSLNNSILKRFSEALLNNKLGNLLDTLLMKITCRRWGKKTLQKRLNMHGVILSMNASQHCAKPDPVEFQNKLMLRYEEKVSRLVQSRESSMVY